MHSEALSGIQRHSEAIRGPSARGLHRPSPCVASKHPVPHIRSTHLIAHPPTLLAAVFHAQHGSTPLHWAAHSSSSVAVVQALLAAYPEAATATDNVCRPSPLAAWMRGPERSSEVIICNQGQSGVIIRNQRALSGTQRAISGLSVALSGPQRALRGPQR
jgi:hypothetical protein